MNVGVLGSGMVGQTIAGKVAELGHSVVVGTRNPAKLEEWRAGINGDLSVASFAEAAAHGELLFVATNGVGTLDALTLAGAANLDGKILIDITNPLDFSRGMPPTLFVANDDSLGEQIQRTYPAAKVVKTLNTVTAAVMIDPQQLAGGDHTIFVSGNDAGAKAQVTEVLKTWFGWRHVIDAGDITTARGTEIYVLLWVRLWGALGTPMFNVKLVQ
jgi:predicted dinucleotide-binding enzyme